MIVEFAEPCGSARMRSPGGRTRLCFPCMELPVLPSQPTHGPEVIVRAIARTNAELTDNISHAEDLDCGRAFSNPERPRVWDANCIHQAFIPEGSTAADVMAEVQAHYQQLGRPCYKWFGADSAFPSDLADALQSAGWERGRMQVMRMVQASIPDSAATDLQVIPARAMVQAFHAFRRAEAAAEYGEDVADHLADCATDVLDDSRLDMLVARRDREVVGVAGVMAAGDIGIIYDVQTHREYRRQGIMTGLLAHVLDLCARSQFKTIVLETGFDNTGAIGLYERIGMERFATMDYYYKTPATS